MPRHLIPYFSRRCSSTGRTLCDLNALARSVDQRSPKPIFHRAVNRILGRLLGNFTYGK
jgi:hypothetical protein